MKTRIGILMLKRLQVRETGAVIRRGFFCSSCCWRGRSPRSLPRRRLGSTCTHTQAHVLYFANKTYRIPGIAAAAGSNRYAVTRIRRVSHEDDASLLTDIVAYVVAGWLASELMK